MNSKKLITDNDLSIRGMVDSEDDYRIMLKWLSNAQLLEFYEGRDKKFTLDVIKGKYKPRILGETKEKPCIATLSNVPIGYLQYYELSSEQKNAYDLDPKSRSFGIDLFIGETEDWNKGFGSRLLKLFVSYLFAKLSTDFVTIDPRIDNERAIKSYEKVGFRKVKILKNHEFHEGTNRDNWLMVIDKNVFRKSFPEET